MDAMGRTIEIKKVQGKWTVLRDDPLLKFKRGTPVTWILDATGEPEGNEISAQFQFCHEKLVTEISGAALPDLTAHVGPVTGGNMEALKLRIHQEAERRDPHTQHYYAVWISDPSLAGGGAFAVGETQNPPPELDLGP